MIPRRHLEALSREERPVVYYVVFSEYCATCQHWTGTRTADEPNQRVYTPVHATIGHCASPTSHWTGRLKPGESSCRHWIRWDFGPGPDSPGR